MRSIVEGHPPESPTPRRQENSPVPPTTFGGPPPPRGRNYFFANGFFALRRISRTGTASSPSSRRIELTR